MSIINGVRRGAEAATGVGLVKQVVEVAATAGAHQQRKQSIELGSQETLLEGASADAIADAEGHKAQKDRQKTHRTAIRFGGVLATIGLIGGGAVWTFDHETNRAASALKALIGNATPKNSAAIIEQTKIDHVRINTKYSAVSASSVFGLYMESQGHLPVLHWGIPATGTQTNLVESGGININVAPEVPVDPTKNFSDIANLLPSQLKPSETLKSTRGADGKPRLDIYVDERALSMSTEDMKYYIPGSNGGEDFFAMGAVTDGVKRTAVASNWGGANAVRQCEPILAPELTAGIADNTLDYLSMTAPLGEAQTFAYVNSVKPSVNIHLMNGYGAEVASPTIWKPSVPTQEQMGADLGIGPKSFTIETTGVNDPNHSQQDSSCTLSASGLTDIARIMGASPVVGGGQ